LLFQTFLHKSTSTGTKHTPEKKERRGKAKFVCCLVVFLLHDVIVLCIFFLYIFIVFYMGLWGALFDIPIPFVSAAPFTFLERVLCILAAKKGKRREKETARTRTWTQSLTRTRTRAEKTHEYG